MYIFPILIFVIGLSVGSFLNVLVLRLNTEKSLSGRSGCLSCRHQLAWYDLIPVLSFIFLKGRCRYCGSKISLQYPIIELVTGLALVFLAQSSLVLAWTLWESILYVLASFLLIAIAVYDFRHKIVPDQLVYPFIVLGLFSAWSFQFSFLDYMAGPIFFAFFALLWLVSSGTWMGFGDAKLVLGIGLLLGFWHGFSALTFGFWSGACVGIFLLFLHKQSFKLKSEIPFAPFLAFGAILAILLQGQITSFLTLA